MTISRRYFALGTMAVIAAAATSYQSRNAIARAQSCSFTVSPARVETEGPAQSGTITVDTQDGCTWTVSAAASWVQLDRTGGTGPGVIGYTVETLVPPAPFRGDPIRQTTIQVRWNTPTLGQNILVTQVSAACNAAIGFEGSATFGPRVARGRLRVLAESFWSGPWYIKSAPDWITFTSPPLGVFGRGDGDAYFSLSPNPGTTPRDGVIETCGRTEYIRQAGRSQREGPYVRGDFDDDGIADLAVFRTPPIAFNEPPGLWFVLRSSTNYSYAEQQTITFGPRNGTPFPLKPFIGDYDGDGKTDLGVAERGVRSSVSGYAEPLAGIPSGVRFDDANVPVIADFNGDRMSDFASYRSATGEWFVETIAGSDRPAFRWGWPGDQPVPGDYDGDGRADGVVWRPSTGTWFVLFSSGGYTNAVAQATQWGGPGDIPVNGDFDGDGRDDPTVWRPSEGRWYMLFSSTGYSTWRVHQWGEAGDIPVANHYDGDRITDLAVWRPSTGVWYLLFSSSQYNYANYRAVEWGRPGDVPIR